MEYVIVDITSLPVGIILHAQDIKCMYVYVCDEMFPSDANLIICTYVACQSTRFSEYERTYVVRIICKDHCVQEYRQIKEDVYCRSV